MALNELQRSTQLISVKLRIGRQTDAAPATPSITRDSHVITERGAQAVAARRDHTLVQAQRESNREYKIIWVGLAKKLDGHVKKSAGEGHHGN